MGLGVATGDCGICNDNYTLLTVVYRMSFVQTVSLLFLNYSVKNFHLFHRTTNNHMW